MRIESRIFLLVSSTIGLDSCNHVARVTEPQLIGAWYKLDVLQAQYAAIDKRKRSTYDNIPQDIIIDTAAKSLFMYSYSTTHIGTLTKGGDSILLRMGCLVTQSPIQFRSGPELAADTLVIAHLGKFVRMTSTDSANFISQWRAFSKQHQMNSNKLHLTH